MSLITVAERLRNAQVDRIVRPFRESRAAVRRTVVMIVLMTWAIIWAQGSDDHFLAGEARFVMPLVIGMSAVTFLWAIAVRRMPNPNQLWVDVSGSIADFVGIAILLHSAWNLMLPLVACLPLACVTTGARYPQRYVYLSVAAALVIVLFAAPEDYWGSRPAVALLAVALIAGIPLTFNRVLAGLSGVSEQAIEARDSQVRFLAMMSHELRTPLHTVINAASMVGAYDDPEEKRQLARSISDNANVLLARVNDVLDVAASDAGQIMLISEPFDMRAVMESAKGLVAPLADEKNQMLTFMYDERTPLVLDGDRRRIEQVITNLAGNAVKYTPRGGSVLVTLEARDASPGEAALLITVSDTGIGIPDDQKTRVFEAFHQVSSGAARTFEGVGLGLHIVQLISSRMGGRIDVADNPGGGTIFSWRLCLSRSGAGQCLESDMSTASRLTAHRDRFQPLHCLVVDDNASNREIMGRLLERSGNTVEFASDGHAALSMLHAGHYDITYLDLHMPGLSGMEVLETLNQRTDDHRAPRVAILTASTDSELEESCRALGACCVLNKPLSIPALLDSLARASGHPGTGQHCSPMDTMRSICTPAQVRSYVHTCVGELEESMQAVRRADPAGGDAGAQELLHRLKNSLLNAGMARSAERVGELAEQGCTYERLQTEVPKLQSLVEDALNTLREAPELS